MFVIFFNKFAITEQHKSVLTSSRLPKLMSDLPLVGTQTIDSGITHAALAEQSLTQASIQELSQPFGWTIKLALLSKDLGYPYIHAPTQIVQ